VDVKQADGPRIIVPVPLFVARTALAFAPNEATHIDVPELAEHADQARQIVEALMAAPDGVLVEVRDASEHVLIEKVGDEIEIDVDSGEETVSVSVPLTVAFDVLASYDGDRLETSKILAALASASRTNLVHVRTAEEEVKVWIW